MKSLGKKCIYYGYRDVYLTFRRTVYKKNNGYYIRIRNTLEEVTPLDRWGESWELSAPYVEFEEILRANQ